MNLHDMKQGEFVKHVRSKKVYVLVWYHGKLLCQPWNTERWEVERNRWTARPLKKVHIPANNLSPFEWLPKEEEEYEEVEGDGATIYRKKEGR